MGSLGSLGSLGLVTQIVRPLHNSESDWGRILISALSFFHREKNEVTTKLSNFNLRAPSCASWFNICFSNAPLHFALLPALVWISAAFFSNILVTWQSPGAELFISATNEHEEKQSHNKDTEITELH